MKYMILKMHVDDDHWEFVNAMNTLDDAQHVAEGDAVRLRSDFSMYEPWTQTADEPDTFWRGMWTRQTTDMQIFYQILHVKM